MNDQHQEWANTREADRLLARRVSLLECVRGRETTGKKSIVLVITLGNPDASVDQVALDFADSKKLLCRLAVTLGDENLPLGPATEQKILKRWIVPHSVGRAELNVEGEDEYLDQLKQDLPELQEYLVMQFKSLRRVLHRVGKGAPKPETLMKKVKRLVLVALDAGRSGT